MALDTSDDIANAMLDAAEGAIGTSPILRIRTGAQPGGGTTSASTGTVLATMNLPSDFLANASGRSKGKSGTWQDPTADATGTPGHFEIVDSGGTVCKMRGSVTLTGGGGNMTLDSMSVTAGQQITITSFALTA